jgi:hypothetical protein
MILMPYSNPSTALFPDFLISPHMIGPDCADDAVAAFHTDTSP